MKTGFSPTYRLLIIALLPLVLGFVSYLIDQLLVLVIIADVIIVLICLVDLLLSNNSKITGSPGLQTQGNQILSNSINENYSADNKSATLNITVDIPPVLKSQSYNLFNISVKNSHFQSLSLFFLFDTGPEFSREYSRKPFTIAPYKTESFSIRVFCFRRGSYTIDNLFVSYSSIMGLFKFYSKVKIDVSVKILPFVPADKNPFSIMRLGRRDPAGHQKNRIYGDGSHFELLRDYNKGDEYSRIDWKATARKGKPITRVYRTENRLSLAIMLDCGRLLSSSQGYKTLLDFAVDSALTLSYSALKWGDSISLTGFADNIITHIPPSKDLRAINRINYSLSTLDNEIIESDYKKAFGYIGSVLSKRSLIVLFTDIYDDSNIKIYKKCLSVLSRKHSILIVLLRDKKLFDLCDKKVPTYESLYTKIAAIDLANRREKTIREIKKIGVSVLDLYPEEVNSEVINEYSRIKMKGKG